MRGSPQCELQEFVICFLWGLPLSIEHQVSEYTDKVDILTWKSKTGRIHEQIRDICAILSGLAVAADYEVGQKMIKDRSFEQNSEYFSSVFEIGRRHKILNPECMRTDYGKLVHMLMDSQNPDIQRLLEFKLVKKVRTVYDFLKGHDALSLLKHPDVITATTAIVDRGRSRQEVQQAIKVKEAAVKRLIRKFSNDDFGEEEIEWCLYSIGDNSSFLVFNRDPVDQMISYLTKNFPENLEADSARSLAIRFTQTSNNMHPLDCYIFNFSPLLHFQVWLQRSKALPSPQPTVPVLPANPHALERDSERHVQAVVFGRGGPAPCQQLLFPAGHRPRPQQGAVSANHRKTHA